MKPHLGLFKFASQSAYLDGEKVQEYGSVAGTIRKRVSSSSRDWGDLLQIIQNRYAGMNSDSDIFTDIVRAKQVCK